MITLEKNIETNKCQLELLAGGGSIEGPARRSLLDSIFSFLFSTEPDLTMEKWQNLEQNPRAFKAERFSKLERYQQNYWHN